MPVSNGFKQFVADLFAPLEGIAIKPMFGGLGIFHGGRIFAVAINDGLYFRADPQTQPRFEAEGRDKYRSVDKNGKAMSMPYSSVPERLFDDAEEFAAWSREAMAASIRAKGEAGTKPAPRRKPAKSKG